MHAVKKITRTKNTKTINYYKITTPVNNNQKKKQ